MSAIDELLDLVAASGLRITFDPRRYARAALCFPDCLPPMFGEANAAVERWGIATAYDIWTSRRPEDWPTPTVQVGELWEQKSSLIPTWEMAASLPAESPYRGGTHRVVRIAGERFINERGYSLPWNVIPGLHWRLLEAAPVPTAGGAS